MSKKFVLWFICFVLSFLVEIFGWTEQGRAFLYLDCGALGMIIALIVLLYLLGGSKSLEEIKDSITQIVICAIWVGIILFASWGATKLFDVDFFVAYQIMRFGQCLYSLSSKND